jgi:hypothetical protein
MPKLNPPAGGSNAKSNLKLKSQTIVIPSYARLTRRRVGQGVRESSLPAGRQGISFLKFRFKISRMPSGRDLTFGIWYLNFRLCNTILPAIQSEVKAIQ